MRREVFNKLAMALPAGFHLRGSPPSVVMDGDGDCVVLVSLPVTSGVRDGPRPRDFFSRPQMSQNNRLKRTCCLCHETVDATFSNVCNMRRHFESRVQTHMIHIDLSLWPLHLIQQVSDTWTRTPASNLLRGGVEGLGRMLKRMRECTEKLPMEIFLDSTPSASSQVVDDDDEQYDDDLSDFELDATPLSERQEAERQETESTQGSLEIQKRENEQTHWVIQDPFGVSRCVTPAV